MRREGERPKKVHIKTRYNDCVSLQNGFYGHFDNSSETYAAKIKNGRILT